jgi:hypothetical protein
MMEGNRLSKVSISAGWMSRERLYVLMFPAMLLAGMARRCSGVPVRWGSRGLSQSGSTRHISPAGSPTGARSNAPAIAAPDIPPAEEIKSRICNRRFSARGLMIAPVRVLRVQCNGIRIRSAGASGRCCPRHRSPRFAKPPTRRQWRSAPVGIHRWPSWPRCRPL